MKNVIIPGANGNIVFVLRGFWPAGKILNRQFFNSSG